MGRTREGLEALAAQLRATGLSVALDPEDANIPGAVIYPRTVDMDRLDRAVFTITADLLLVAGGVRASDALDQLDTLLDQVTAAFPEVTTAQAVTAVLGSQSADPLPALSVSLTGQFTYTEGP